MAVKLFEEIETLTLFGNTVLKVKGRMSFFKRLAYDKGAPVARWEDILIAFTTGQSMVNSF